VLMDWEERNFKKVDGGHVFFPYGPFSRGYIVDDAKKAELIAFIKQLNRSWPVFLIAAAAGWWIAEADGLWMGAGLVALPFTAYYQLRVRRTLAGLPRTDNRRTFSEQLRATADAMPSFCHLRGTGRHLFHNSWRRLFFYESLRDRDVRGLLLFAVALPIFALSLLLTVRLLQLRYSRRNLS
jgi:hypothetical protein